MSKERAETYLGSESGHQDPKEFQKLTSHPKRKAFGSLRYNRRLVSVIFGRNERTHRRVGAIGSPKQNPKFVGEKKFDCGLLFFVSTESFFQFVGRTENIPPRHSRIP